jgi:hypothetical protein
MTMSKGLMLLLCLALSGCPRPSFNVKVRGPELTFVVEEPGQSRPRYHSFSVSEGTSPVWTIRAEPFGDEASQSLLRYGVTPAGFIDVTPSSSRLQPGEYKATVRGIGVEGGVFFRIESDGTVQERSP